MEKSEHEQQQQEENQQEQTTVHHTSVTEDDNSSPYRNSDAEYEASCLKGEDADEVEAFDEGNMENGEIFEKEIEVDKGEDISSPSEIDCKILDATTISNSEVALDIVVEQQLEAEDERTVESIHADSHIEPHETTTLTAITTETLAELAEEWEGEGEGEGTASASSEAQTNTFSFEEVERHKQGDADAEERAFLRLNVRFEQARWKYQWEIASFHAAKTAAKKQTF
jgi:hypothetical protein